MSAPSLAELVRLGKPALLAQHGGAMSDVHHRALHAIEHCRSGRFGHTDRACADCGHADRLLRSCGNRACPQCQHRLASQWLERQQAKLLPVRYFMATFTVPRQLRPLAIAHQRIFYDALFAAAIATLRSFAANDRHLHADIGACAVLHTHSRRLDFHPHLHVVIPGGGVDTARRQWRAVKGKYLFNARKLAIVFRAKLIHQLHRAGLSWRSDGDSAPDQWVVHCADVGKGLPALKYLSRYLYRGVIAERNIVDFDDNSQEVIFRFSDAKTGTDELRTLPLADFLWRLMLHVLPAGYRRVREYGFLHANARGLRTLLQIVLRLRPPPATTSPAPVSSCPQCGTAMRVIATVFLLWRAPPGPQGTPA